MYISSFFYLYQESYYKILNQFILAFWYTTFFTNTQGWALPGQLELR